MRALLGILICLLLLSFSGPEDHYRRFKEWYATNASQLIQKQSSGSNSYTLRYLPKEIKVVREIADMEDVESNELKELNEKYDAFYEFNFKIHIEGVQDVLVYLSQNEEEYNGLLFYLLEDIIRDFTLVTSEESKKPLQCSYENNYGTAPYLSFHLVFGKEEDEKLQEFLYEDFLISGGENSFDLSTLNELKIPKIK